MTFRSYIALDIDNRQFPLPTVWEMMMETPAYIVKEQEQLTKKKKKKEKSNSLYVQSPVRTCTQI